MRRKREKILRPVWPNAGIEAEYRRRLRCLVDDMNASFLYWLKAAYRATPPVMAQDESTPASQLRMAVNKLARQWQRRFDDAATGLARYFALAASKRSDAALRAILRDGGFSVKFTMTPAMRDIMKATIPENVSLIRSIPQQYLTNVAGAVYRSVQTGRDLGSLTEELEKQYGVTRRRAALISRDQNNKMTSAFTRARQVELGIDQAVWLHSHGGKEPRPTHFANTGKRYDPAKGWFDPDPKVRRYIFPGELINCFPASTGIVLAHDVKKAYRRRYSGHLAEIVTDQSKTLSATPNHPILTPLGWRPIGSLNEGDYVVHLSDQRIHGGVDERDEDERETLIANIFDAVCESGLSRLEVSLRDDFHGDGADSEVDIVLAARQLSFGRQLRRDQRVLEFPLSMPAQAAFLARFLEQLIVRCSATAALLVRGARQTLATGNPFAFHPLEIGCAATAWTTTSLDDILRDRSAVLRVFAREIEDAAPALMFGTQVSRIISVRKFDFQGHVFNLETASGWYAAEGIIAHNCRCVSKPVIKGFS